MLSPERSCLRPGRPGTVATTSASLRYWNSARQRHCRPSERYQNIPASLPTRSPSHPRKPAPKAGFSTFESGCGRETDCLLEGDGFELPVPRELISAGGRNPAASGSTSALDGATRAQLGGAERTVARKGRKTGIFPPFRVCAARKIRRLAKSGIKENQW